MKTLLFLSLLSLTSFSWSAQEWIIVAETMDCGEKVEIQAEEGETFVYAVQGGTKTKLFADDGSAYKKDAVKSTVFSNSKDKSKGPQMTFIRPAYVDGNPPKISIVHKEKRTQCNMSQK